MDAFQLSDQHTDGLGARRGFHVRQLFDCQAVRHRMDVRTNPADTFDQIEVLDPGALLGSLLDATVGVSKPNIGAGDHFPIHRELEMAGFLEGRVLRADRDGKAFGGRILGHSYTPPSGPARLAGSKSLRSG